MQQFDVDGHHVTKTDIGVLGLDVIQVSIDRAFHKEISLGDVTFVYVITEGHGVFFVNNQPHRVAAGDMIVILPGERFWYAGRLKAVLANTPNYTPGSETTHRSVPRAEIDRALKNTQTVINL
ncbi:MAG: hypothetical protein HKM24_04895 [Gammaproteobacteria bacterium]|nr:hypothetical protein [Gammaproteobacteria bacterium]